MFNLVMLLKYHNIVVPEDEYIELPA